ncbi:MAG: hypothetical protein ABL907_24100 [Hyphomicrobium sp.]
MSDAPQKKPYQSTMERHPEHVRAIGMISIELANLEVHLADLLGVMLNRSKAIAHSIYFTPRANIARIDIIIAVANVIAEKHPKPARRVQNFGKRARNIMQKRHDHIHNAWGVAEDTGKVGSGKLPMRDKNWKPVDDKELLNIVSDLRNLITEIADSLDGIHDGIWDARGTARQPDQK